MPASFKSLSAPTILLIGLTLACWLYMLWSMAGWFGKTPLPGRGEDKAMQQAFSAGAALLLWLLVGGLLIVAGTKANMPASVGIFCWMFHPLSCLFGLAAIAIAYDVPRRWAVAIPVVTPLLIGAYAVWLLLGMGRPSAESLGVGMWALVLALSIPVVPAGIAFQRLHMPKSDSVEAVPGPELDAFLARERERQRQSGLEAIRNIDEDTTVGDLENLTRGDSPVKKEALAAILKLPHKQTDVEKALAYNYFWVLKLLPELDVEATPTLCQAARQYIQSCIRDERSANPSGMSYPLSEGIEGIRWIAAHCECGKQLDALDELAAEKKDQGPDVAAFRAAIRALREAK